MKQSSFTFFLCLCLLVLITGCVRTHHARGNFVTDDRIAEIHTGMTQDEVAKILGTPSFHGMFKDDTWYYYGVKESTVAFLDPRIDETRVVEITFDKANNVSAVNHHNGAIDQAISTSSQKTVDLSHKKTLFRTLFGNVGRFNKSSTAPKSRVGQGS